MAFGRFRDLTQKPQVTNEQHVETGRPTNSVLEKYITAGAKQKQAEENIQRVLGNVAPEVASEVLRRAASDERFDPEFRAALDPDGIALHANLHEIEAELKAAELKRK